MITTQSTVHVYLSVWSFIGNNLDMYLMGRGAEQFVKELHVSQICVKRTKV